MISQGINLINLFQTYEEDPFYQAFNLFPMPIEMFTPDGTSVFINRAWINFTKLKDPALLVGKYNLLNDPVCNDELGMREGIQKAFSGEPFFFSNITFPIDDLVNRGLTKERPFERATMDYLLYPIRKDDELSFVVCVFVVRDIYSGRQDVAKIREYIDTHWQGKYNHREIAKTVDIGVSQIYNLFKRHLGMTPGQYQKKLKVEHIKEKLANKSISIKESFASCGEDSQGNIAKVFKEITGMSPREYRESL